MLIPRTKTLQSPPPQSHLQSTQQVPLVITYHPAFSRIARTLRTHLHVSDRLKATIPVPPIDAHTIWEIYLCGPNWKKDSTPTQTGNNPCINTHCKTCNIIMREEASPVTAQVSNTGQDSHSHAKQKKLVYLIQCSLQYVGETENPLHIRMNGHRSGINTWKLDKPVAAHFNQSVHSLNDLRVMGIEMIHTNSAQWRKRRESYWIFILDTTTPKGMNLDD